MPKLRLKRVYEGCYKSVNATPEVTIYRSVDDRKLWIVSYDDYVGRWSSYTECRDLVESVASMGSDHMFPIKLK